MVHKPLSQVKNPDMLRRDGVADKGWILNTGLTVAQNAALYINSTDTGFLDYVFLVFVI
jgi:mannuronan 5-epimerase